MFEDFKEFAVKGNVVDMAVGLTVGVAFSAIARSLVDDIIMPPIGLLLGRMSFSNLFFLLKAGDPTGPYQTLADAQDAGAVVVSYGQFINNIITFLIVAVVMFFIVREVNRLRRQEEEAPQEPTPPTTRDCPYCLSEIPIQATRCAYCTAQVPPAVTDNSA